jgi:hypothetical protein
MNTKRKSQFNKAVKVREKQWLWLMENKGKYKTLAGKLDEIINAYKNEMATKE